MLHIFMYTKIVNVSYSFIQTIFLIDNNNNY